MKILSINNIFYRKGGSEAVFFNTSELLVRNGHEVRMFSISGPKNISYQYPCYFAPEVRGVKKLFSYFYNIPAAKSLDRLLSIWKPDIAHIHLVWGGLSPSIIKVLHKHHVPIVHTAHDYRLVCPAYTFRDSKGQICEKCQGHYLNCILGKCSKGSLPQSIIMAMEMRYRRLFHYPVRNIDGFIFVSEFSRKKHIEHDRRYENVRTLVLHNFTEQINTAKSNGYFLFSGRLSQEKGCCTLVKAFMKLPGHRLVIAGSGPEEKKMKEMAKCSSNITFTGHLDKAELFKLIASCAYVVVPSEWYENNPMTIIESYAASKPVIAAATGGIPEIVAEGNTGYLFESGNVDSLCHVLESCPSDTSVEYHNLCSSAANYYRQEFSPKSYVHKIEYFYHSIITGRQLVSGENLTNE